MSPGTSSEDNICRHPPSRMTMLLRASPFFNSCESKTLGLPWSDRIAAYLDDVTGREILRESNYRIEEEQADHDTQINPIFINSG